MALLILLLLVLSLGLLVIGVMTASASWIIGSLVVVGAAFAAILAARRHRPGKAVEDGDGLIKPTGARQEIAALARQLQDEHEVEQVAGPAVEPARVWVIDGQPHYHRAGCSVLASAGAANPETIPLSQAQQDDFAPCSVCLGTRPTLGPAQP